MAVIRYHVWWPSPNDPFYLYNMSENAARKSYYGITGVPAFKIDGTITGGGYTVWQSQIASELNVSSPLLIDIYGEYESNSRTGELEIVVTATEPIVYTNLRLRIAITESDIYWAAPNGGVWHHQTFRDLLPNTSGIPFTISEGQTIVFNQSFSCPLPLVPGNCEIVAFVQSDNGRRILQGAKEDIRSLNLPYFLSPFSLISPYDDTTVSTCYPFFVWHASDDPDSGFAISYKLYLSMDSTFADSFVTEPMADTFWQCPVCLQNDSTYYWKVMAFNSHAPERFSEEVFTFTIDEGEVVVEPGLIDNLFMVSDDTSRMTITISNLSFDTVSYTLSDSGDIIGFENDSGELDPFTTDSVTVFFSSAGLAPGNYKDTIYVSTSHILDFLIKVPVDLSVYVHGDANCDNSILGSDVTFLVRYFKGIGQPPCPPLMRGDANGNCDLTGSDVTYLVSFFKGSVPAPSRGDCQ